METTASVIAILQLSGKIITYCRTASGHKDDRDRLRHQLEACNEVLQFLIEDDGSEGGKAWVESNKKLADPSKPLYRLQEALENVQKRLELPSKGSVRKGPLAKALAWPFRKQEVEELMNDIQQDLSHLLVALQNNSGRVLHDLNARSEEQSKTLDKLMQALQMSVQNDDTRAQDFKKELLQISQSQRDTAENVGKVQGKQDSQISKEERLSIVKWLFTDEYQFQQDQQQAYIKKRLDNTGEWLLDSIIYKTWVKADGQTLFCPGPPGAGKSILTSVIVQDLKRLHRNDKSIGLAFTYCIFKRQDKQSLQDLLACLLRQLVERQPVIPESIRKFYQDHEEGEDQPLLKEILKILQLVVASYSKVYILVDALDECQEATCRPQLLRELFELQKWHNVNFLATSRCIDTIEKEFTKAKRLKIRADSEDVRKYLNDRILNAQIPKSIRTDVILNNMKDKIVHSMDGMFLVAHLLLESVINAGSHKAIISTLDKLSVNSKSYDSAYESTFKRIEEQGGEKPLLAKRVLAWITYATRILTPTELCEAIAVEDCGQEIDAQNLSSIEDLVSLCAGLVVLDKNRNMVQLIHHTTQEFLQRPEQKWYPGNPQEMIARTCTTYLSFEPFKTSLYDFEYSTYRRDRVKYYSYQHFVQSYQMHALLVYAACCWAYHAQQAQKSGSGETEKHVMDFLRRPNNVATAGAVSDWDTAMTGLHLAARFGLATAISTQLKAGAKTRSRSQHNFTPLMYAVRYGHESAAKLLLDHDERGVNLQNNNQQTALHLAALHGRDAVARLLLQKASVTLTDKDGHTALHIAAREGRDTIVGLLLEKNAEVNARSLSGATPLQLAAYNGYITVAKRLLKAGAAVNNQDQDGDTSLIDAAESGHTTLIKLLLDSGAHINTQNKKGTSALLAATEMEEEAAYKFLLERGAEVNTANSKGRTPLFSAAKYGPATVVQKFLDGKADIHIKDNSGFTPLHFACASKYMNGEVKADVVNLLLKAGAEKEHLDNSGRSALFIASMRGEQATVQILLEIGANPNAQGHDAKPPLWATIEQDSSKKYRDDPVLLEDHLKVMDLLLDAGADIDCLDQAGRSPLVTLVKYSEKSALDNLDKAALLIEKGANISLRDCTGMTPLLGLMSVSPVRYHYNSHRSNDGYFAWCEKFKRTAHLFFDAKACVDEQDKDGCTPLFHACRQSNDIAVRILLDHGADLHHKDCKGNTILSFFLDNLWLLNNSLVSHDYDWIVQMLEDKGARLPNGKTLTEVVKEETEKEKHQEAEGNLEDSPSSRDLDDYHDMGNYGYGMD